MPTIKTQIVIYKELLPVRQCCYYGTIHTPVILLTTKKAIWRLLIPILHEQVLLAFAVFNVISPKPLLQNINQIFHGPFLPVLIHSHQIRFDVRQFVECSHHEPL